MECLSSSKGSKDRGEVKKARGWKFEARNKQTTNKQTQDEMEKKNELGIKKGEKTRRKQEEADSDIGVQILRIII